MSEHKVLRFETSEIKMYCFLPSNDSILWGLDLVAENQMRGPESRISGTARH